MWVKGIRLADFRSYEQVEVELTPGVTTFVGPNGQGKTNLVEAIGYVSILGSHRVATDAPLVRIGADRAVVGIEAVKDDRSVLIELEINPGKANRARINRSAATRPRDVVGIVRTVVFAPEDLALVKGDPSDRRRFIDDLLIQRSPRMLGVKADYDRILKQRNALLKSAAVARRVNADEMVRTLEVWDDQMCDVGADLVAARVALLTELQPHLSAAYELIASDTDSASDASMTYVSSLGETVDLTADRTTWREQLQAGLESRRKEELDRGLTLVGPQRDDILFSLGAGPAKGYASHGESWSIALAARLASMEVLRSDGDDPVLILDDVFAELDSARRRRLTQQVAGTDQVLITAAVTEDVPRELVGRQLRVSLGSVSDD
ncbi:MAG: DNA replication/repair protein RecF [Actinomycetes bacterium]